MLRLIIGISVMLMAVSLLAMVVLILRRALRNWRMDRERARAEMLVGLALEYLEEPEFLPAFKAQLRKGDEGLLVEALGSLLEKVRGDYPQRIAELMRHLGVVERSLARMRSRAWWERAGACVTLGWFQDPRVEGALNDALTDRSIDVRVAAARSLVKLGKPPPVGRLLDQLAPGQATHTLAVTDMFRSLARTDAQAFLEALADDSHSVAVRVLAVDALGHSGELSAVPGLIRCAETGDAGVRVAVLKALSRLVDPRAVPLALRCLSDPVWEVRAQAALCAGYLGARESVPLLQRCLSDPQWWVRYEAAEALFKMGGQGLMALWEAAGTGTDPLANEIAHGLLREKGLAA